MKDMLAGKRRLGHPSHNIGMPTAISHSSRASLTPSLLSSMQQGASCSHSDGSTTTSKLVCFALEKDALLQYLLLGTSWQHSPLHYASFRRLQSFTAMTLEILGKAVAVHTKSNPESHRSIYLAETPRDCLQTGQSLAR